MSRHSGLNRGPTDYESFSGHSESHSPASERLGTNHSNRAKSTGTSRRFMEKVSPEPNTGCWAWTGAHQRSGYGTIRVDRRVLLAHRVAFALFVREPSPGHDVDHLCRNRWCVNPAHLEEVTHAANMRRTSKLSPDDVARIRELVDDGWGRAVVAQRFGVHVVTVGQIVRGDRWGDADWLRPETVNHIAERRKERSASRGAPHPSGAQRLLSDAAGAR
jgi:hypothetical protein